MKMNDKASDAETGLERERKERERERAASKLTAPLIEHD